MTYTYYESQTHPHPQPHSFLHSEFFMNPESFVCTDTERMQNYFEAITILSIFVMDIVALSAIYAYFMERIDQDNEETFLQEMERPPTPFPDAPSMVRQLSHHHIIAASHLIPKGPGLQNGICIGLVHDIQHALMEDVRTRVPHILYFKYMKPYSENNQGATNGMIIHDQMEFYTNGNIILKSDFIDHPITVAEFFQNNKDAICFKDE